MATLTKTKRKNACLNVLKSAKAEALKGYKTQEFGGQEYKVMTDTYRVYMTSQDYDLPESTAKKFPKFEWLNKCQYPARVFVRYDEVCAKAKEKLPKGEINIFGIPVLNLELEDTGRYVYFNTKYLKGMMEFLGLRHIVFECNPDKPIIKGKTEKDVAVLVGIVNRAEPEVKA